MNYNLIRILDKYVGTIACLIISLIRTFLPKPNYVDTKKILITKFWGIGSIILASPTMKAIREKFPNAEITFLTLERNKKVYEDSGLFDKVLYFRLNHVVDAFPNFLKILLKLRKQKFDLAIDLDTFAIFTPLLLSLTKTKIKIGHKIGRIYEFRLYDKSVIYNNNQHVSDNFFNLAKLLGIKEKPSIVKMSISRSDKECIESILEEKKIKKLDKIIGININAGDFGLERRWPNKNFAELADRIIQNYNVKIIFTGLDIDKELVNQTINLMKYKGAINFAGKTATIKQLAFLIQKFDFLITNDTGPMHVAVAMETPVIAFFGPETPSIYGPVGKQHTVFYKHLPCSPCLSVYNAKRINCKHDVECMKSITVDEVMEKVKNYLK